MCHYGCQRFAQLILLLRTIVSTPTRILAHKSFEQQPGIFKFCKKYPGFFNAFCRRNIITMMTEIYMDSKGFIQGVFRCASISSTYPCLSVRPSVGPSVRPSHFRISNLSASLVALREKLKRDDPNYFVNFGSGCF